MTDEEKAELFRVVQNMRTLNGRDKERRFCRSVLVKINEEHRVYGLKKVWSQTEADEVGSLLGTPLEKWYDLLREYRLAFAEAVEAGNITGFVMTPTTEIL